MKLEILMVKFLWGGEKVKISNFIGWFCLKGKLPEQKIWTVVSCPDSEGLCKVSAKCESWFPIQLTQKWWNFLVQGWRNFAIFWYAEFETRIQILLKLCTVLHCQGRKLLCEFAAQAISLLQKTKCWNFKFGPSPQLEEILPVFVRVNWKRGFRFCWNFPQPFTVRTGRCCVTFFLKEFYLSDKTNWWNLKFWWWNLFEEARKSKFLISLVGFV